MRLKYFLSRKELIKIEILDDLLISQKRIFPKDLTRKFNVSKNSILRYTAELQEDLTIVFDDITLCCSEDGDYYLEKCEWQNRAYLINHMKEFYIDNSSLYLVLKAVISTNLTIPQIAETLNYSLSTVYAKLTTLNTLAEPYEIEIDITHPSRFKGREFNVRFFLYHILLFQNRTIKQNPFPTNIPQIFLDLTNIETNLISPKKLTSSHEMRIRMIQGISLYRTTYHQEWLTEDDSFLKDIIFFNESNFNLFGDNDLIATSSQLIESRVFCFLLRASVFEIESFQEKRKIISKYQQSGLKIAQKIEYILESFAKFAKFEYTTAGYTESYYLLLINLIYLKHVSIDLCVFYEDDTFSENPYDKTNEAFISNSSKIKAFIQENSFSSFFTKIPSHKLHQLVYILHYIFDINTQPKQLNIFIQFSKNIHTEALLAHSLTSSFSSEALSITKNPDEANLFVSDSYEGKNCHVEHFFFENTYNSLEYQRLYQFITRLIYDNMFFKKIE
ncbi:helix-turn-helix domain-containing protein [Vagococcus hydrophili]|uniref:Mga helix-turn-helix domain-containing protein n=1 Tax=Vagococcus hydrophili TaxID=2714947 RepID=A0A6G8AR26_9ENTE|nr:helix-turn-helix domain-containing protein [Vagococcus hydrophili]QIL47447.1 hypothetical protein G7082_02310 [Vagococcus hydrophili]